MNSMKTMRKQAYNSPIPRIRLMYYKTPYVLETETTDAN